MSGDRASSEVELLAATMKRAAVVLKGTSLPFALAGGYAVYARGGHPSLHDVDFFIREQDAEAFLQALGKAGFRPERPAEDWLVKAYDEDRLVDLVFASGGRRVDDELLARAEQHEVLSVAMPVVEATDLFVGKLLAFEPHDCDFTADLAAARALREQVDWERLARETEHSPYARAFLQLIRELGIAPEAPVRLPRSTGRMPA